MDRMSRRLSIACCAMVLAGCGASNTTSQIPSTDSGTLNYSDHAFADTYHVSQPIFGQSDTGADRDGRSDAAVLDAPDTDTYDARTPRRDANAADTGTSATDAFVASDATDADAAADTVGSCEGSIDDRACRCSNGRRDGSETDIDCGGPCDPCRTNMRCETNNDCRSKRCEGPTIEGACPVRLNQPSRSVINFADGQLQLHCGYRLADRTLWRDEATPLRTSGIQASGGCPNGHVPQYNTVDAGKLQVHCSIFEPIRQTTRHAINLGLVRLDGGKSCKAGLVEALGNELELVCSLDPLKGVLGPMKQGEKLVLVSGPKTCR
jgi:hypothetical protein